MEQYRMSWSNVFHKGAYGDANTGWIAIKQEEEDARRRPQTPAATPVGTAARSPAGTAAGTLTLTGRMSYGTMLFYGFMLIIALLYAYVNMTRGIPPLFVAILAFYTISSINIGVQLGIETSLLLAFIMYIGFLFR